MGDEVEDEIVVKRTNCRKRSLSNIEHRNTVQDKTSLGGPRQKVCTNKSDIWFKNSFCGDMDESPVRPDKFLRREADVENTLNSSDLFLAGIDIDDVKPRHDISTHSGLNINSIQHMIKDEEACNQNFIDGRTSLNSENTCDINVTGDLKTGGAVNDLSDAVDTRHLNTGDLLDSIFGDLSQKRIRKGLCHSVNEMGTERYKGDGERGLVRGGHNEYDYTTTCNGDMTQPTQPTQPVRLKSHIDSQFVIRARRDKTVIGDATPEDDWVDGGYKHEERAVVAGLHVSGESSTTNKDKNSVPGYVVASEGKHNNKQNMNSVHDHSTNVLKHGRCSVSSEAVGVTSWDSKSIRNGIVSLPSTDHTPVTQHKHSLKSRIRDRLQENAAHVTPLRNSSAMREDFIQRVTDCLSDIPTDGEISDAGSFFGLPDRVRELYDTQRGIKKLYDWQKECLELPSVVRGDNLIYSLPTSGGKTLVAEVLILKQLLCKKKNALFILPFVSIVQEKVRNFANFAADLNFLVEEYAGSKGRMPPTNLRKMNCVYIATIEKGHSLVNSLIESGNLSSIGLVVIDELHMIGEGGSRGSTLETTLLKIKRASDAQLVAMSATLNNTNDLQKFLDAQIYTNDFRPVELTESIKLMDNIYTVDERTDDALQHSRVLNCQYTKEMTAQDPDHLLALVSEVIPQHSCLVFCATKKNCENVAVHLCKMMSRYKRELSLVKREARKALYNELVQDGGGRVCPVLQSTLKYGVAYHHSGLTMDERRVIEEAYSNGVLCALTCTSTLAAGVNLPAKRVILRSPYVGCVFIRPSQYKQMIGRAGRAGIDTSGESILITQAKDKERVKQLLGAPLDTCRSSLLYDGGKGLRSLVLSLIGLKLTTHTEQLFSTMTSTLLAVQSAAGEIDVIEHTRQSLQQLVDMEMVKQVTSDTGAPALEVTPLGRATFKGCVDIDDATLLYKDLMTAEAGLVLTNHLHLLNLVTPYEAAREILPDWMTYFNQVNKLDSSQLHAMSCIGVPEGYIARRASGQSSKQKVDPLTVNRFYLTLILHELWNNKTVWDVANMFQLGRGYIQNLLNSAASFAVCTQHFCQELEELWPFVSLLDDLVRRLTYCVNSDLIPLMEIAGVKIARAKQLHKAGYHNLASMVNARPAQLTATIQHLSLKAASQIINAAKVLMSEKMEALFEEVDQLVTVPDGHRATVETTHPGSGSNTGSQPVIGYESIPSSQISAT